MENESLRTIHIGLAGFGNVGAGVYKNLKKNAGLLRGRTGVELSIKRVAVKDPTKERGIELPAGLLTGDWRELVADPAIGVIVELIGGVTEAFELVKAALRAKKAVVTGNKALLAEHGKELIALAEEEDVPLYLEAAVAGGIPIIKAVREALIGNHILSIHGIINGTSNFILTRMDEAGISFADALAEAQAHGYAEADPALDINGWDAGHKAIILAWLSYGLWLKPDEVLVEGIENLQLEDIRNARQLGYAVGCSPSSGWAKTGAPRSRRSSLGAIRAHLGNVNGVFNAVALLRRRSGGDALLRQRRQGKTRPPARSSPIWRTPPTTSSTRRATMGSRPTATTAPRSRRRRPRAPTTCGSASMTSPASSPKSPPPSAARRRHLQRHPARGRRRRHRPAHPDDPPRQARHHAGCRRRAHRAIVCQKGTGLAAGRGRLTHADIWRPETESLHRTTVSG
ncbi:MAG: homoserine dehydrogenase [Verrucomicrobiales bacterium]